MTLIFKEKYIYLQVQIAAAK